MPTVQAPVPTAVTYDAKAVAKRRALHAKEDRAARSASCVHCGRSVSILDRCSDGNYLHAACAHATSTASARRTA